MAVFSTITPLPIRSSGLKPDADGELWNSRYTEIDANFTILEGGTSGEFWQAGGGWAVPSGTGSTNGHVIQDEGISLTQRVNLDFIGGGVTVADNVSATEVTIPSTSEEIVAASSKATPIDADTIGLVDSADSNTLKSLSWANIKATLKTYLDTLYVALTGAQTIAGVKTFSSFPITPSSAPSADYEVANKKYVDDTAGLQFSKIFNGAMTVAQRATSEAGITAETDYPDGGPDLAALLLSSLGTWTFSQAQDTFKDQGFSKSLRMECTTAQASPGAAAYNLLGFRLEGQNLQDLEKGLTGAKQITVSFWVKSNLAGTYIAELQDSDNTRAISKSFTISAADTPELITLTFDADTTGELDDDANLSMIFNIWLAAGSNFTSGALQTAWGAEVTANRAVGQANLAASVSNYIEITALGLYAGDSAPDFLHSDYGADLNSVLRYYSVMASGNNIIIGPAWYQSTTSVLGQVSLTVAMRAIPTLEIVTGTGYYISQNGSDLLDSLTISPTASDKKVTVFNNSEASGTAGQASELRTANASAFIAADARL